MDSTLFLALALVFVVAFVVRILQGEKVGTVDCSTDLMESGIRLRLTVLRHRPKAMDPQTIDLRASVALAMRLYPMTREEALALADHLDEAVRLSRE